MENFSELIKNRRSMRKFTGEELSQEQVVALLKAALMAPTSKRSNSWQFIAVDDKEILKVTDEERPYLRGSVGVSMQNGSHDKYRRFVVKGV